MVLKLQWYSYERLHQRRLPVVKLFMCHHTLKYWREHFCKYGSHRQWTHSVYFGFSIAILAKVDYKLFALFVFIKARAWRRQAQFHVLHNLGHCISIIITGTNSLLVNSIMHALGFFSPTELVSAPLKKQSMSLTSCGKRTLEFLDKLMIALICHLVWANI